jgi:hypothetical protein
MIICVPKRVLVAIVFFPAFGLFQNAFKQLVTIIPKIKSIKELNGEFAIKKNVKIIYDHFAVIFVNIYNYFADVAMNIYVL